MLKTFLKSSSCPSYDSSFIGILRLIRSDHIGIKTFYNLIKYYGSAQNAIEHLPDFMAKIGKSKFKLFSSTDIEKEIEKMNKIGAQYVSYESSKYPILLQHIDDAPPIITYKGDIELASKPCAAIVGARNCSIAGRQMTNKIAKNISDNDIIVVSGLARGIDTEAHLASEPNTIAVIAGGIGNIYPPENHKLYNKIEKEGLIIAELPIETAPLARHFPQRNRIISGVSKATIVIEATLNSGSLITAKFALEQNREIFACPGFPLDPRHKGTNKLIKEGANLLESAEEIIEFFKSNDQYSLNEKRKNGISNLGIYRQIDKKLVNKENKKLVLNCISSISVTIEDIIQETDLPISIIATILLELELTEKIVYQPGNKIVLNFTNI